jgi:glycosyltransferase A (GT-A) superfamily protein (DUF2064 family)
MGRWPAPGRCKSRLAVALGSRRAAAIQRALSGHGLAEARRAAALRPGLALVLAVSGLGPKGSRRWAEGLGADWVGLQGEGRLGWRLQRQLLLARRHGAQRTRPCHQRRKGEHPQMPLHMARKAGQRSG